MNVVVHRAHRQGRYELNDGGDDGGESTEGEHLGAGREQLRVLMTPS